MAKSKGKSTSKAGAKKESTPKQTEKLAAKSPLQPAKSKAAESKASNIEQASTSEPQFSYDRVPYPSYPYSASHPDRMFAMAKLFALSAVDPAEARVLELGCAAGGNLLPLATTFPKAKFVGVDLSAKQIEEGSQAIKTLKLKNAELIQADVSQLPAKLGKFDYIICHGVFSWVPVNVQQAILKICKENLTQSGIAYISYNTLPGWYMRNMIRGMMLKHVGHIEDPKLKLAQARALLSFLVESTAGENSPYAAYLRSETELLNRQSDQYLFHDHLEEHNTPMFFQDFMQMAAAEKLQFLGESSLASMWIGNLPAKATATLEKLTNDVVLRSQYSDFVRNRTFRQTLLCHQGREVNRALGGNRLEDARYVGRFVPDVQHNTVDLTSGAEVLFNSPTGHTVRASDPSYKAMLLALSEAYPRCLNLQELQLRVSELVSSVLATSKQQVSTSSEQLSGWLLQLLLSGACDFRFTEDRFTSTLSDRPKASAWSRWQATLGNGVTSQRHEYLQVCDVSRLVLPLLDGTRDHRALLDEISKMVSQGKLNLQSPDKLSKDQVEQFLKSTLERLLKQFLVNGLLVS